MYKVNVIVKGGRNDMGYFAQGGNVAEMAWYVLSGVANLCGVL